MTNAWKEKRIKKIVGLLRAYDLTETASLVEEKTLKLIQDSRKIKENRVYFEKALEYFGRDLPIIEKTAKRELKAFGKHSIGCFNTIDRVWKSAIAEDSSSALGIMYDPLIFDDARQERCYKNIIAILGSASENPLHIYFLSCFCYLLLAESSLVQVWRMLLACEQIAHREKTNPKIIAKMTFGELERALSRYDDLYAILRSYDRKIRNCIAHGGITYDNRGKKMRFEDYHEGTVTYSISLTMEQFKRLFGKADSAITALTVKILLMRLLVLHHEEYMKFLGCLEERLHQSKKS